MKFKDMIPGKVYRYPNWNDPDSNQFIIYKYIGNTHKDSIDILVLHSDHPVIEVGKQIAGLNSALVFESKLDPEYEIRDEFNKDLQKVINE